jgi:arsenate reductase-like glutaredoxin family protein
MLKQAAAASSSHATEDQASDHSHQTPRAEFELDITEEPPTEDQLKSIMEYLGGSKSAGVVVKGARDEEDAFKKLRVNKDAFERPLVCDLANGQRR